MKSGSLNLTKIIQVHILSAYIFSVSYIKFHPKKAKISKLKDMTGRCKVKQNFDIVTLRD